MLQWVAVHFACAREQEACSNALCHAQHIQSTQNTRLSRLYGVIPEGREGKVSMIITTANQTGSEKEVPKKNEGEKTIQINPVSRLTCNEWAKLGKPGDRFGPPRARSAEQRRA